MWGPRANVNMQESAILITMNNVARNKETFLENYYLKNKHTDRAWPEQGPLRLRRSRRAAPPRRSGGPDEPDPPRRGRGPHCQRRVLVGNVQVAPGDYIVRMDQPYGAIVETLLGVQFYSPDNPRPYDDTGWAIPLLRNVKATAVADKSILSQPMTLAAADFVDPGHDYR